MHRLGLPNNHLIESLINLVNSFLKVLIQESLYVLGMSIFTFQVLPHMNDVIMSLALMTGVGFLPGLLSILSRPPGQRLWVIQLILDIAAFAAQVRVILKPIYMLRYAFGLRFGNVKRSKTREKSQSARIFTQHVVLYRRIFSRFLRIG